VLATDAAHCRIKAFPRKDIGKMRIRPFTAGSLDIWHLRVSIMLLVLVAITRISRKLAFYEFLIRKWDGKWGIK
jgi:hypothetical protein